jgi:hypothetical protein
LKSFLDLQYVFTGVLVSTQKILGLIQDGLTDLVDIFGVGMLALSLAAETLLAEADALGLIVDVVLLDRLFASFFHTVFSEVVLTVFCEKMLASHLFDSGIEICAVIKFFDALLVIRVTLRTHHIGKGELGLSGTIVFV